MSSKKPAEVDPNSRRNLPTPDHVAAKENAEVPPNDETMSDQPGTFQETESIGPERSRIDTETMSDRPTATGTR